MKEFLKSMLSGPAGDISVKRVSAIVLVICGIVFEFVKGDAAGTAVLLGAACTILGVGAITKT